MQKKHRKFFLATSLIVIEMGLSAHCGQSIHFSSSLREFLSSKCTHVAIVSSSSHCEHRISPSDFVSFLANNLRQFSRVRFRFFVKKGKSDYCLLRCCQRGIESHQTKIKTYLENAAQVATISAMLQFIRDSW